MEGVLARDSMGRRNVVIISWGPPPKVDGTGSKNWGAVESPPSTLS